MKIKTISCDICSCCYEYPSGTEEHFHPELEIGGVPMNIWTPEYDLPSGLSTENREGILKFIRFLPFHDMVTQGEGQTEMLSLECIANSSQGNTGNWFLKDESTNPTRSFKDRGMPLLVADAISKGKNAIAICSTGNAAVSLVSYSRLCGIDTIVFVPEDTPQDKKNLLGDNIVTDADLVKSYEHSFDFCRRNTEVYNGFPVINIPYYHGLKTTAYEIFMQMGNQAPDWIVMPVGSGTNIVGQYYGFRDLYDMGLTDKMPRFVAVQIKGADPITIGFNEKKWSSAVVLENTCESEAESIASDTCFNYFKIMKILRETNGIAVSVTDREIKDTFSGGFPELEYSSHSVYAAIPHLDNFVQETEKIVLIGTAGRRKND